MRRAAGLFFALWAALAFADGTAGASNSRLTRGNLVRIPVYETPGTGTIQNYYVDPGGSDSSTCQAATTPCKTIQGAVNKVPKLIRDGVVVNLANGSYSCFYLNGFYVDYGLQQASGGLSFIGNLATATVATGTATGTSTSGSTGSGSTFGTLVDSGQTWTVNDLRGKIITAGAATAEISSNTATTVTIVGQWANPGAGTTYTIQIPGATITTNCPRPPSALAGTSAGNGGAIFAAGNNIQGTSASILFKNIGFSNAAGAALRILDSSSYQLVNFRITGAGASGVQQASSFANGYPRVSISTGSWTGSTGAFLASFDGTANVFLTNVLSYGSNGGLAVSNEASAWDVSQSEANNATIAGLLMQATSTQNSFAASSRFDCAAAGGYGVFIGGALVATSTTLATSEVANFDIGTNGAVALGTTCGVSAAVQGPAFMSIGSGTTGTGATTGVLSNYGGRVAYLSGAAITGATQDWSLDNGNVVGAFADITAGSCATTSTYGTRICK